MRSFPEIKFSIVYPRKNDRKVRIIIGTKKVRQNDFRLFMNYELDVLKEEENNIEFKRSEDKMVWEHTLTSKKDPIKNCYRLKTSMEKSLMRS